MHFELSHNKKSFLKNRKFINLVFISFIAALVFGVVFFNEEGKFSIDLGMGLIFLGAFIIATIIFLHKQKSFSTFEVDDFRLRVNNKNFLLSNFKKFHLLGESQSERFGSTRLIDPVNPYKYASTQIFRIKIKRKFFNSWLNLEVDREQADAFLKILIDHGVPHASKLSKLIGI